MYQKEKPPASVEQEQVSKELCLPTNSIILISGSMPGTGSSCTTAMLKEQLNERGYNARSNSVGELVREHIKNQGFDTNETGMQAARAAGVIPENPETFDVVIYEQALLHDGIIIIEGRATTQTGYNILQELTNRPIYLVNLEVDSVTSAMRVLKRENMQLEDVFKNPQLLIEYREMVLNRTELLQKKIKNNFSDEEYTNPAVKKLQINTVNMQPLEIIHELLGSDELMKSFSDWEEKSIQKVIKRLYGIYLDVCNTGKVNELDKEHFNYNLGGVNYAIKQAKINTNPEALKRIRKDLAQSLHSMVYALLMKIIPRFFYNIQEQTLSVDTITHQWTPRFYKIINGWDTISSHLEGQSVLDPFAGAGTYLNLLAAKGVVKEAYVADIAYPGGKPLNGYSVNYAPDINKIVFKSIFDELPSWYYPHIDETLKGTMTADATQLPLKDNAVDWITGDPPYGRNLDDGSISLLKTMLPELCRVSKKGALLMVPMDWLEELSHLENYVVEQLTQDLSLGVSNFKICFVKIESVEKMITSTEHAVLNTLIG